MALRVENKFIPCFPYGSVVLNNPNCFDCCSGKFVCKSCNRGDFYCAKVNQCYLPYPPCVYPESNPRCKKRRRRCHCDDPRCKERHHKRRHHKCRCHDR